jgi:hypothetical protein
MGGEMFFTLAFGKDSKCAFREIVRKAQYDYGHAGYTGTIAEKSTFIEISLPPGMGAETYADTLIENGDPRVDDKWGPAGCIEVPEVSRGFVLSEHHLRDQPGLRLFLFFGWASS